MAVIARLGIEVNSNPAVGHPAMLRGERDHLVKTAPPLFIVGSEFTQNRNLQPTIVVGVDAYLELIQGRLDLSRRQVAGCGHPPEVVDVL